MSGLVRGKLRKKSEKQPGDRPAMDTLFYDGKCPLCLREIRLLRRISDDQLQLVDVHELASPEQWPGLSREQLLQRLHLLEGNARFQTGLRATVRTWQHTSFGWLFSLLLLPGIRPLANWAYERWATRRYCRLYACQLPHSE